MKKRESVQCGDPPPAPLFTGIWTIFTATAWCGSPPAPLKVHGLHRVQIRQDLSCFGEFGQQGYSYNGEPPEGSGRHPPA